MEIVEGDLVRNTKTGTHGVVEDVSAYVIVVRDLHGISTYIASKADWVKED